MQRRMLLKFADTGDLFVADSIGCVMLRSFRLHLAQTYHRQTYGHRRSYQSRTLHSCAV